MGGQDGHGHRQAGQQQEEQGQGGRPGPPADAEPQRAVGRGAAPEDQPAGTARGRSPPVARRVRPGQHQDGGDEGESWRERSGRACGPFPTPPGRPRHRHHLSPLSQPVPSASPASTMPWRSQHDECRGQREAHPGRQHARHPGLDQADAHAHLAAARPRQELAERYQVD